MRALLNARRHRGDLGFTLIELLVAMSIGSIVLAGVGAVTMAATRASRTALVRTENAREVRGLVEGMVVSMRVTTVPPGGTDAFLHARPSDVAFYALLNRSGAALAANHPPTLVRWWWDSSNNCVYEQRSLGVPIVPTPVTGLKHTYNSGVSTLCVAHTTVAPTFQYYTSSTATTPLSNSSAGLSAVDMAKVRSVEIQIQVNSPRSPDVSGSLVRDRVSLVNLH